MPARRLGDPTLGGPGFQAVERALRTITRYRMIEAGETVVVALSGGPDSTCLLDVLARLTEKLDLSIVVGHVDHRLSSDSADIATRVTRDAAAAGFEVHLARAPDLSGPNLHARARDFRYEFLDIVANREGATKIATGHTLDDRVETTLARLIHGAGTSGLAGIPPVGGNRVRPLIELRRTETRGYCEECGLAFIDDPGNDDPRFDRTAIRGQVIAAIEERWGDGAIRAMATAAQRLHEDAEALTQLADRLYTEIATPSDDGVRLDLGALRLMTRSFRRRMLESAVGRVRDRSGGIDAALDALEDDARVPGSSYAVASGIEIRIHDDHVLVYQEGPRSPT
ncbi:MAG: tRNA lysidine(34) synthetase TilS [Actinomycetota bacterium]|nr:tRNA lysidine(34) synthetase TilS [Actinomycetota bacterium]